MSEIQVPKLLISDAPDFGTMAEAMVTGKEIPIFTDEMEEVMARVEGMYLLDSSLERFRIIVSFGGSKWCGVYGKPPDTYGGGHLEKLIASPFTNQSSD